MQTNFMYILCRPVSYIYLHSYMFKNMNMAEIQNKHENTCTFTDQIYPTGTYTRYNWRHLECSYTQDLQTYTAGLKKSGVQQTVKCRLISPCDRLQARPKPRNTRQCLTLSYNGFYIRDVFLFVLYIIFSSSVSRTDCRNDVLIRPNFRDGHMVLHSHRISNGQSLQHRLQTVRGLFSYTSTINRANGTL